MSWILTLFLLYFINTATTQTLQDAKDLNDFLFADYRKTIRPTKNMSAPTDICVAFFMLSINDFRETEETLVINGALSLNWTDPSLIWNPSDFGNISDIQIDSRDIWTPWFYLVNSADELAPIGSDSYFYASVMSYGQVAYSPGGILEAKCITDISKFPLDVQICRLSFIIWSAGATLYKFSSFRRAVLLTYFTANSNWDITEHTAIPKLNDGEYYSFDVTLSMKRKSAYFIVMVILPTIMLCLLNPLVFLLPVQSGERISFAITVLLSYAIFLTIVSSSVPTTPDPMCRLLSVIIAIMIVSCLIIFGVILSSVYSHSDLYDPGKIVGCIIKIFNRKTEHNDGTESKHTTYTSGQSISKVIDKLFMVTSYFLIVIILAAYFIAIAI